MTLEINHNNVIWLRRESKKHYKKTKPPIECAISIQDEAKITGAKNTMVRIASNLKLECDSKCES